MSHKANDWIESLWQGKAVRQVSGTPELVGRTGQVEETMWDEKGALHCRMSGDWWCPAQHLEMVKYERLEPIYPGWGV